MTRRIIARRYYVQMNAISIGHKSNASTRNAIFLDTSTITRGITRASSVWRELASSSAVCPLKTRTNAVRVVARGRECESIKIDFLLNHARQASASASRIRRGSAGLLERAVGSSFGRLKATSAIVFEKVSAVGAPTTRQR